MALNCIRHQKRIRNFSAQKSDGAFHYLFWQWPPILGGKIPASSIVSKVCQNMANSIQKGRKTSIEDCTIEGPSLPAAYLRASCAKERARTGAQKRRERLLAGRRFITARKWVNRPSLEHAFWPSDWFFLLLLEEAGTLQTLDMGMPSCLPNQPDHSHCFSRPLFPEKICRQTHSVFRQGHFQSRDLSHYCQNPYSLIQIIQ